MDLYPHQKEGVDFLTSRDRAYLADGMGLGKTIQACRAAAQSGHTYILVVAPASTLPNWEREWARWGGGRLPTFTSYARAARETGYEWDLIIFDEAHYLKNPRAKRTKVCLSMAREAKAAWLLSGTPMPNNPLELYAPIRALWPGYMEEELGISRKDAWLERFCKYYEGDWGPRIYGARNVASLVAFLKPIMLRRTADQVLDLPPLRVTVETLDRPEPQDLSLRGLDALEDLDGGDLEFLSTIRRVTGAAKADLIGDQIADELDRGEYRKVVVLAHHHDTLDMLEAALGRFGLVRLTGKTLANQRQPLIDSFNEKPEVQVFLGQQTASGTGLNLQAANEIVLVEPSWVPADNLQAIKRIHRIGQDDPCRARFFALTGSIDFAIMSSLATKTEMLAQVGLDGA